MLLKRKILAHVIACGMVFIPSFSQASSLKSLESHKNVDRSIQVTTFKGKNIISLLPLLHTWAAREFSQYPYFYSPPKDTIACPFDLILANSKDAVVILAKKGKKVVGMAALISFDSEPLHVSYFNQRYPHLLEQMKEKGFEPAKMLYAGYFLTDPACHNDSQVVQLVYENIVSFAKSLGKTQVCYMDDIGFPGHPKAATSQPIEPWRAVIQGFQTTGIQIPISWPTLDQTDDVKEIEHTLEFFVKDL